MNSHHDSDSDDENHEDHKSKHNKSHAHDEHSEHHHHHLSFKLKDGQKLEVNEFHHDPKHENGENHYHDVELKLEDGSKKQVRFIHEGRVHKDVPSWHHLAKFLNTKPTYVKQVQAVELSKSTAHCDPVETKPSAPEMPPPYNADHEAEASNYNPTLTGQMQRQHLLTQNKKEEDCCSCTIQ